MEGKATESGLGKDVSQSGTQVDESRVSAQKWTIYVCNVCGEPGVRFGHFGVGDSCEPADGTHIGDWEWFEVVPLTRAVSAEQRVARLEEGIAEAYRCLTLIGHVARANRASVAADILATLLSTPPTEGDAKP